MCSRVRFRREGKIEAAMIGQSLLLYDPIEKRFTESFWDGHARSETFPGTWAKVSKILTLPKVLSYWEPNTCQLPKPTDREWDEEEGSWFEVEGGEGDMVFAMLTEHTLHHYKDRCLCVTREARTEVESSIHHRHPLLLPEILTSNEGNWRHYVSKLSGITT